MGNGRFRQNAVAKIEDIGLAVESLFDAINGFIQCPSPSNQSKGIQIALNRLLGLDFAGNPTKVCRCIKAQSIDALMACKSFQMAAYTSWKGNDPGMGNTGLQPFYNRYNGLQTPFLEFCLG